MFYNFCRTDIREFFEPLYDLPVPYPAKGWAKETDTCFCREWQQQKKNTKSSRICTKRGYTLCLRITGRLF